MAETTKQAGAAVDKRLNIYQKLAAITGEIGVVAKDGRNQEQKFAFIEYAAVAGRLRTLFAKYGVVVVPRMQRHAKQHRVEITSKYGAKGQHVLVDMYFDVVNADEPSDHFTVQWTGEAADYGDKATNKAATSALKYYLMRQFNISEKGEDADEESPHIAATAPTVVAPKARPAVGSAPKQQFASEIQKRQIKAYLEGLKVSSTDMQSFLEENFGIIPGTDMLATDAANIIKELRAWREEGGEPAVEAA